MDNGIIPPNTEFAKSIGFTSGRFDGYLWKNGDAIIISFIVSKQPGQGHFGELIRSIEAKGFRVKVPTPLPRMQAILEHYGFVPHAESFAPEMGDFSPVEVWERPAAVHN